MARSVRDGAGRLTRESSTDATVAALIGEPRSYTAMRMPIYEYRRQNGTTFEVVQKMTDDALTVDPETGKPVERVFHAPAIHFKGKGFHNTDYGTRNRNRETESAAKDGADKTAAKAAEKKADKKAADSSGSSGSSSSSSSSSDSGSKKSSGEAKKPAAKKD